MDRARYLRRAMAPQLSRKRERAEQSPQSFRVLALVRIDFRIRALQITIRDHCWSAVPRSRDVDHVEVVLVDHPVQMHPREGLPRIAAPMSQQPLLEASEFERLAQ